MTMNNVFAYGAPSAPEIVIQPTTFAPPVPVRFDLSEPTVSRREFQEAVESIRAAIRDAGPTEAEKTARYLTGENERMRVQIDAIRDKARRFKGWRVVWPGNIRSGLLLQHEAHSTRGHSGRVVRCYRKGRP